MAQAEDAACHPAVSVVAYGVQEALMDVRKSAGAAAARVPLHYGHDAPHITVESDGVAVPPADEGNDGPRLIGA